MFDLGLSRIVDARQITLPLGLIACIAAGGCAAQTKMLPVSSRLAETSSKSSAAATLVIALPEIAGPGYIVPGPTAQEYLSNGTVSVKVRLGTEPSYFVQLSKSAGTCTDAMNSALACSIRVKAPVSPNVVVDLATYQNHDGEDRPLAQSVVRASTHSGRNDVTASFVATARRLAVKLSKKAAWQGSPSSVIVSIYGIDFSGSPIFSTHVVDKDDKPLNKIVISGSGPYPIANLVNNGTYPAFTGRPFSSAIFSFDGQLAGSERLSATAKSSAVTGGYALLNVSAGVKLTHPAG